MDLLSTLRVRRGERIALVGGGGKTSLAYRIVAEARQRGWTAIFTTTTKVLVPDDEGKALVIGEGNLNVASVRQCLRQQGWVLLVKQRLSVWEETPVGRRQKLGGFDPDELGRWDEVLRPDLLVVEADGSRHLPFKAPADYEPVVPSETTLLVVVAGLAVLGRPLAGDWVHRPEQVAQLVGVSLGVEVDSALVAAVLSHRQGGLKAIPPAARAVAVLTQATAGNLPGGREIARRLLRTDRFERVLLTNLHDRSTETEVWRRDGEGASRGEAGSFPQVHVVILAAGGSERMGQNKLLLPLANRPLLAHAVDAALGSRANAVWVVLGAEAEALRQALGTRPVQYLFSQQWAEGQSASIREAVAALGESADGILFLAGDMPFVPAAHLDRLIDQLQVGTMVVWSEDEDVRRIPALFGRAAFPALMRLEGDKGGKSLVGSFPEVAIRPSSEQVLFDVDTPSAYEWARQRLEDQER